MIALEREHRTQKTDEIKKKLGETASSISEGKNQSEVIGRALRPILDVRRLIMMIKLPRRPYILEPSTTGFHRQRVALYVKHGKYVLELIPRYFFSRCFTTSDVRLREAKFSETIFLPLVYLYKNISLNC